MNPLPSKTPVGPRKRDSLVLPVLLFLILPPLCAHGEQGPPPRSTDWALVHSTTMRGIHALYNTDMDRALAAFDSATFLAPTDPRGRFFRSMVLFWTYTLTTSETDFDRFMACSDTVIEMCEEAIDQRPEDATPLFYLGGIRGYRGMASQLNGSMLRAAYEGREGYTTLEEAIRIDTSLVDAQMGFGIFNILLAKIPRSFAWIARMLGFEGDLEAGFRYLRVAATRGVYTRTEATFYLSQFLFAERKEEEALRLMEGLLKQFPENALFQVVYAGWNNRLQRFDVALRALRTAEEINQRKRIRYGEEFIHSTRGAIHYSLNDFATARREFDLFLTMTRHREQIPNYTFYRIAVSREIMGDRAGAIEACRLMKDDGGGDRPWERNATRRGKELAERPLDPVGIELVKGSNLINRKAFVSADSLYRAVLLKESLDPDHAGQALYGLQLASIGLKDDPTGVEAGMRLVKLHPVRETWLLPHAWVRMAESYERLGRRDEALRALDAAEMFDDYEYQSGLLRTMKEIRDRLTDGNSR